MEAPLPPSGLNYNEFRTWRKEQGIRSTRDELTNAWTAYRWPTYNPAREYNSRGVRPTSPQRVSPRRSPRKSPKSPVRYAGFSSASLLGLPKDLGRIVGSHLDAAAVLAMRKASTGTSKLTDLQMEKICAIPITAKELLNVIDEIPTPFAFGIIEEAWSSLNLHLLVIADSEDKHSASTLYLEEATIKLKKAIEDDLTIRVAPGAMKAVLEQRLSCVKLLPALPRSIALKALYRYTRNALHKLVPSYIVHGKAVIDMLQGTGTVAAAYPSEEMTENQRQKLRRRIAELHDEVNWITADSPTADYPIGYANWRPLTNEEVQARFVVALNEEVARLRALYRNL
jgi:hypothetical protein